MNNTFRKDVLEGLSMNPKRLPSMYFYDEKGDRLFQEIMKLDEYYLTRAEYAVLRENAEAILESIQGPEKFSLVEFGAGDGSKTKLLLRHFLDKNVDFSYRPIDISGSVLKQLTGALKEELSDLEVIGMESDYFTALMEMNSRNGRKVVLFLGSNIGNFTDHHAGKFLAELYSAMNKGDMAFIGFDLKKDPGTILRAYNDSSGVTAEFNLNLLDRINRELDANFVRDNFFHYPVYNPMTGQAKSFLISRVAQEVTVNGHTFRFRAWEAIHTEISRKFDPEETNDMAREAGFEVVEQFFDKDRLFMDVLWKK